MSVPIDTGLLFELPVPMVAVRANDFACAVNSEGSKLFAGLLCSVSVSGTCESASPVTLDALVFHQSLAHLREIISRAHQSSSVNGDSATVDLDSVDVLLQCTCPNGVVAQVCTTWKGKLITSQSIVYFAVSVPSSPSSPSSSAPSAAFPTIDPLSLLPFWQYHGPMTVVNEEGKFQHVNAAFVRLFGYEGPADIIGQSWDAFILRKEKDMMQSKATSWPTSSSTLSSTSPSSSPSPSPAPDATTYRLVFHHETKDGQHLALEWYTVFDPASRCYFSIARDITSHEKVEDEQRVLRSFFVKSQEAFVVATVQGDILQCNDAAAALFGVSSSEALRSQSYLSFLHPDDCACALADIQRGAMRRVNRLMTTDASTPHMDGTPSVGSGSVVKWVEWTVTMERDDNMGIEFMICRDVTAVKRDEERLARDKEQKNVFFSMIGEEVRTPVNAIKGSAQLLAMDDSIKGSCELRTQVAQVSSATDELLLLIDNLMTFPRLQSEAFQLVETLCDVRSMVAELQDLGRSLLTRTGKQSAIAWEVSVSDRVPRMVVADQKRFIQCIANIIANAIRTVSASATTTSPLTSALPSPSSSSSSSVLSAKSPQFVITLAVDARPHPSQASHVWLDVSLESTQASLPTVMKSASSSSSLSCASSPVNGLNASNTSNAEILYGMNLTLVSGIVSHMKGSLAIDPVRSNEASGSTSSNCSRVSCCFPFETRDALPPSPLRARRASSASRLYSTFRILCAEDDAISRKLMESWLKRLGFHAVEHYTMVDNGATAVEAFVGAYRAGVPYDLVLLDLMMPTMGGIEACSLMRAFVEEQRLVANGRNAMSITMDEGTEAELYAPFIAAVTASVTEDDRLATRRVGFDRFFEKPFHCEKLRELVKELMTGAQHTA